MRVRLLLASLLALATAPSVAAPPSEARFAALVAREQRWSFEQFPLLATYAGMHEHDHRLGDVRPEVQEARRLHWEALLKELARIDVQALAPPRRIDYAIFRGLIENQARAIAVNAHLLPFTSDSAFYTDIQQLPRMQPLRTLDDHRRYLARLADLPRWFDEHVLLLERGLERGYTLPRVVLEGRDAPIAAEAEREDPTTSPFYAPFAALPDTIPAADAEALRAEARALLAERVRPAYARLLRFFRERYLPGARASIAATALPDGRDYYRQQIREYTTLDLEPEAIHAIGLAEVRRIRAAMEAIVVEVGFEGDFAAFLAHLRRDPRYYARSGEELLMHAAWIAKRVDAELPRFFGVLPRRPFGIAPVPEAIAPYYTGGRYVPAPENGERPAYYWVNTHKLESRPLYTLPALTLHEAMPGHHLQGALAAEQGEQPLFRRLNYISAYGEGWALYAERLGEEMGIYRTPYERFGRYTYEMWRACRLVVDTGMHAMGWSRDRALAFLRDNTALSEHEVVTEIDRYISWPGQALAYKLGELEIVRLRAEAERALGPAFDLRAFHDAVLALGSVPLPVLAEQVREFVAQRRASAGGS